MGNLDFDATNIEPSSPMEAVPSGEYVSWIKYTEKKDTKAGTGSYLQIELEIVDGPYKNRKIFDRLNLWNPNGQAVEIAQKTLSAICHAIGLLKVRNHEELRNKPLIIKVDQVSSAQFGTQNEVKGYKPYKSEALAPATSEESAPVAAAASSGTAPWARK